MNLLSQLLHQQSRPIQIEYTLPHQLLTLEQLLNPLFLLLYRL
jgi:DNA-directed RNA polymerase subunit L